MKKFILILLTSLSFLFISLKTTSHCEVPCGIYDDELQIDLIYEHISTIEKSIEQLNELGSESPVNYNQMVRWINTKEDHATKIQDIVNQYFMTQRVKAVDVSDQAAFDNYVAQITSLHQMLVFSMKSKQSLDMNNIDHLKELTASFEMAYFGEHRHDREGGHK